MWKSSRQLFLAVKHFPHSTEVRWCFCSSDLWIWILCLALRLHVKEETVSTVFPFALHVFICSSTLKCLSKENICLKYNLENDSSLLRQDVTGWFNQTPDVLNILWLIAPDHFCLCPYSHSCLGRTFAILSASLCGWNIIYLISW